MPQTMKKILTCILPLAAAFLLSSCLKDMKDSELFEGSKEVEVGITLPEALAAESKSDFKVMLRNTKTGVAYTALTDAEGVARFDAEYGTYSMIVNKQIEVDGAIKILSASQNIVLTRNDREVEALTAELAASNKGTIILKEVYFHYSKTPGNKNYTADQYVTLYNNSNKVQYLDGIGVGVHTTYNSNTSQPYVKTWLGEGNTDPRDSVPNIAFGFNFPGNGTEHPLQPGEEVVVALSAINHTSAMTQTPINLAADNVWALWIPAFKAQKAPEIPESRRLHAFCEMGKGSMFMISPLSPAVILFHIEGGADEYVKDGPVPGQPGGNLIYAPPTNESKNMVAIMIPKEWVYDGVEFRKSESHVARLCSEISLQPLTISTGSGSGVSYIRKVDDEATAASGHTVYQDTNDSSADWLMIDRPTLANK